VVVTLATSAFGHRLPDGTPMAFGTLVKPFIERFVHERVRHLIFHIVFVCQCCFGKIIWKCSERFVFFYMIPRIVRIKILQELASCLFILYRIFSSIVLPSDSTLYILANQFRT
jgi:hypothetical protein